MLSVTGATGDPVTPGLASHPGQPVDQSPDSERRRGALDSSQVQVALHHFPAAQQWLGEVAGLTFPLYRGENRAYGDFPVSHPAPQAAGSATHGATSSVCFQGSLGMGAMDTRGQQRQPQCHRERQGMGAWTLGLRLI